MKRDGGSKRLGRKLTLIVLLAALCIGAAELVACRYFAPESYERIVAPVRQTAAAVADAGRAGLDAVGRFCRDTAGLAGQAIQSAARQVAGFWEELTAPPPPPEPEPEQTPLPEDSQPPATEPPLTEMLEQDGKQLLTGGTITVTYFCQSDEAWAEQPYGTDTIGPYGCGPTAMAMAVASMTDTDTDPAKMAAWAVEHGYWARRSGSYHSIVQGIAQDFGLEAEAFTGRTPDALRRALRSKDMLVALMGKGHFTTGGHFILIRGVTLSGDVLVADPNSPERSLQTWDPQLILDELSSARDHGAPLWILSAPRG
mgnify:CR=1 FL=1